MLFNFYIILNIIKFYFKIDRNQTTHKHINASHVAGLRFNIFNMLYIINSVKIINSIISIFFSLQKKIFIYYFFIIKKFIVFCISFISKTST